MLLHACHCSCLVCAEGSKSSIHTVHVAKSHMREYLPSKEKCHVLPCVLRGATRTAKSHNYA